LPHRYRTFTGRPQLTPFAALFSTIAFGYVPRDTTRGPSSPLLFCLSSRTHHWRHRCSPHRATARNTARRWRALPTHAGWTVSLADVCLRVYCHAVYGHTTHRAPTPPTPHTTPPRCVPTCPRPTRTHTPPPLGSPPAPYSHPHLPLLGWTFTHCGCFRGEYEVAFNIAPCHSNCGACSALYRSVGGTLRRQAAFSHGNAFSATYAVLPVVGMQPPLLYLYTPPSALFSC